MKGIWQKIDEIDAGASRDFEHLTQALHTIGKKGNLKHELAVILEKCLKDENYKETAIENLIGLAKSYEKVKTDLEYFISNEDADYNEIRPIAQTIIEKINSTPKASC